MGSDLDLQNKQEEFEEQQKQQMAMEAAALVVDGETRAAAVQAVRNIRMEQAGATENELIRDEEGFPDYLLDEAQQVPLPTEPKKLAQIREIAKELIEDF